MGAKVGLPKKPAEIDIPPPEEKNQQVEELIEVFIKDHKGKIHVIKVAHDESVE